MDEGSLSSLVSLLVLIALHALIVLAYAALSNSRESHLREQTETGDDAPPRLHITYQLSLILLQFVIAATAATALGQPLVQRFEAADPHLAHLLAYSIVLIPTALLTLVLGMLVPESIGSARADQIAPWAVHLMRVLIVILSPVVAGIVSLSRALAAMFGSSAMVNVFTEEEIMTLLDAGEKEGTIEGDEKEMIYSVLEFGDTLAREVMVPRIDIVAVEINTPLTEALETFISSGHSRIPVYEDNIDNIKGLLYAKDLLNLCRTGDQPSPKPIREIMRKAFFVPESKRADVLLKELQTGKIHMAVVVDEYGGTAGLLTFEDLLEEIVGDIQDEYDLHEEAEYIQRGPYDYMVDASINLDDFAELLGIEITTEDADTLGGFIFIQLGRVPEMGEKIEYKNLELRIDSLEGRRIRKVHVAVKPSSSNSDDEEAPGTQRQTQPHPIPE